MNLDSLHAGVRLAVASLLAVYHGGLLFSYLGTLVRRAP